MDTDKAIEVVAQEDIRKRLEKLDELIDKSTVKFNPLLKADDFFENGKLINYGTPCVYTEESLAERTGLPLEAVKAHCKSRGRYSPLYHANANAIVLDHAFHVLAEAYQKEKRDCEVQRNCVEHYKENRDMFKSFNDELVEKVKTLKAGLKCAKYNAARNSDLYREALKEFHDAEERADKKRHVAFCIGVTVGAALAIGLALIFIR